MYRPRTPNMQGVFMGGVQGFNPSHSPKKEDPRDDKVSRAPRNFGGELHCDCWYEEE